MSWLNIFGQKKEAVPPPAPGGGARRAAAGDPQEKLRRVQNDREARSADVESIQTKISYETGQYKKAMANNDQASELPGLRVAGGGAWQPTGYCPPLFAGHLPLPGISFFHSLFTLCPPTTARTLPPF